MPDKIDTIAIVSVEIVAWTANNSLNISSLLLIIHEKGCNKQASKRKDIIKNTVIMMIAIITAMENIM